MGEQLGACAPTRDWMRWGRRLRDRLAGPAGELLAHVLDHFPLAWDQLQRLGHILAQLVQGAAAASARRWRSIDDALPRQMLGQRPAPRPVAVEALEPYLLAAPPH